MRDVKSSRRGRLLALPAIALLLAGLVAPLALLARLSLCRGGSRSGFGIGNAFYEPGSWSLQAYRAILSDRYFRGVLGFTLGFGLLTAALSVVLAYPIALVISRLRPRLRIAALAAVVLQKLANVLVVVYGLELLLSNAGPLNRLLIWSGVASAPVELLHDFAGTLIGKSYLILPYAVLVLVAGFARIDPLLALAARGLGAGPWRAFWRVTFPLTLPWLATAFLLSLIFALGAFVTPYLIGGPEQITLAVDVQRQAFENVNWPRAAAEAMAMVTTLCLVVALRVPLRRFVTGSEAAGERR